MPQSQEDQKIRRVISNPLYHLAFALLALGIIGYLSVHYLLALDLSHVSNGFAERVLKSTKMTIAYQPIVSELFVDESVRLAHRAFWHEMVLHASIALFVAAGLIIAVELRVRKLHHDEMQAMKEDISKNVWQAISGRSLPSSITSELDIVLRQNFIKEDLTFHLTLEPIPGIFTHPRYKGKESEFISVKTEECFYIRNITGVIASV